MNKSLACASIMLTAFGASAADARSQMRAVGSSTVYPFAKAVAERVARANPRLGTPIIESTGTGGGMKLFCAGVGARFADVVNASRRMKASEAKQCAANGVTKITEIQVGLDGIALATAKQHPHPRPDPARHLHGDRQGAVRQAQPRQDLEGRQRQAAGAADPRLRAAADQRHARCAGRADDDARLRDQRQHGGAGEERQGQAQGDLHGGSRGRRLSSRPARTTISSSRSWPPTRAPSASSATAILEENAEQAEGHRDQRRASRPMRPSARSNIPAPGRSTSTSRTRTSGQFRRSGRSLRSSPRKAPSVPRAIWRGSGWSRRPATSARAASRLRGA